MLRALREEQLADGSECRAKRASVNTPTDPLQASVELVGHPPADKFVANDEGHPEPVVSPQGFVRAVNPGPVSRLTILDL